MTNLRTPVLVTGATGFIGGRLVTRLLDEGLAVAAFAMPGEPTPAAWEGRVRILRGDIRDPADVQDAVAGAGTVFHLAALVGATGSYDDHWAVTAEGSRNLYGAAASAGARVVVTTSICAYGDRIARDVCREDSPRGAWQGPYGRAKQAQEDFALEAFTDLDLPVSIVRPSNVYGVGSRPWVEGVVAGLRAGVLPVIGDGRGNAGLVHVENVVDALLLVAAHDGTAGRTYNVCDGLDVSWRRYFDDLAARAGLELPPSVPLEPLLEAARRNEDPASLTPPADPSVFPLELLNLVGSDNRFPTTRARDELGWSPRVTYAEGLAEIADHLSASND